MIYGQGVQNDETLPSMLEIFLNRATWDLHVEVINEGKCGYSIYDEWIQFVQRGHRFNPDIILLILCDNDSELFGVQENYGEHVRECWDEKGQHLPYFYAVFEDIHTHMKSLNIPIVVAFYYIYDDDIMRKGASTIKKICDRYGVDFVDLSVDFVGGSSGYINKNMRVSDVDKHPSAQAHHIAALRLARHLFSKGYLNIGGAPSLTEDALYRRLIKNAENMRRVGYRPETVLFRLSQLIKSKKTGKIRLKLPDNYLMPEEEFHSLYSKIERLMDSSIKLLFWQAYAAVLQYNRRAFLEGCIRIDNTIQAVLKKIFVIRKNLSNPALRQPLLETKSVQENTAFDVAELFSIKINLYQMLLNQSMNAFANSSSVSSDIDGFSEAIRHDFESVTTYIYEHWNECERILTAAHHILSSYNSLVKQCGLINDENISRELLHSIRIIESDMFHLMKDVEKTINLLELGNVCNPKVPSSANPYTYINVRLKGNSDKRFNISVHLDAAVPDYPLIQDPRVVRSDGEIHSYQFECPLFILGRLRLRVDRVDERVSDKEFRFEDVRVGYKPEEMLIIAKEDLEADRTGYYSTPLIWIPYSLIGHKREYHGLTGLGQLEKKLSYLEYKIPNNEISAEKGFCYTYSFKTMASKMFTYADIYSNLAIYEDGQQLSFGNAVHDDIRTLGRGHYSMWPECIFFSSSDNSDPRTNGNVYSIKVPAYIFFLESMAEDVIKKYGL